jgi:hypothetical protein
MGKAKFQLFAAVAVTALLASSVSAVTWTKVATSTIDGHPAGWYQDGQRIRVHDSIVDNNGNVYFTTGGSTDCCGTEFGVSIYTPGSGINDVDLTAAGIRGMITEFALGADGLVYAVQNWSEIDFGYGQGWDHKILQIDDQGNVSVIFNATTEGGLLFGDSGDLERDKIYGITTGPNGDIYWLMNTDQNTNWKRNIMWRYTASAQTPVVEKYTQTTDNGWGLGERWRIFRYVEDNWFAILRDGTTRAADAIRWDTFRRASANGTWSPGWEGNVMASAYDPVDNKLWYGNESSGSLGPPSTVSNVAARFNGTTSNTGLFETAPADPQPGIQLAICPFTGVPNTRPDVWHLNGDDSGMPGYYWPTDMAINPNDGTMWTSFGSDAGYLGIVGSCASAFCDVGPVYTMGKNDCDLSGDEGDPEPNDSHTLSIAFSQDGATVYAVTVDLTDQSIDLYSAAAPGFTPGACCLPSNANTQTAATCAVISQGSCVLQGGAFQGAGSTCGAVDCDFQTCNVPFADADGDFDVDSDDYGVFQACISSGTPAADAASYPPVECTCFDTDDDGEVDLATDLPAFINCAGGPNAPIPGTCN